MLFLIKCSTYLFITHISEVSNCVLTLTTTLKNSQGDGTIQCEVSQEVYVIAFVRGSCVFKQLTCLLSLNRQKYLSTIRRENLKSIDLLKCFFVLLRAFNILLLCTCALSYQPSLNFFLLNTYYYIK